MKFNFIIFLLLFKKLSDFLTKKIYKFCNGLTLKAHNVNTLHFENGWANNL